MAGDIVAKNCNRLSPDNTRKLLRLRDWGVLVEAEDSDSGSEVGDDEVDAWE